MKSSLPPRSYNFYALQHGIGPVEGLALDLAKVWRYYKI
jgi:hypothetical protein